MTEQVITEALAHLRSSDPVLAGLMARIGDCTLRPAGSPFLSLAHAITAQLISFQSADAIWSRFLAFYAPEAPTTLEVANTDEEKLRGLGFSRSKAAFIKDLAARVLDGRVPLAQFHLLEDEEIISRLLEVHGIGRWTAEMFLVFALGRPDLLPVDDVGVLLAVQQEYGLPSRPTPAELTALAEPWRPYRSVASWYFWQARRQARRR